jgi:hypothetical protein
MKGEVEAVARADDAVATVVGRNARSDLGVGSGMSLQTAPSTFTKVPCPRSSIRAAIT